MNWNYIAFFLSLGKHSFSKLCLKSRGNGLDIEEAHNFNMKLEIPSNPRVLFGFKDPIILVISLLQISNDEILDVVLNTLRGRMLPLSMVLHSRKKIHDVRECCLLSLVLHCWSRKLLNRLAFIKTLVTSWLFTETGGISVIFLILTNDFKKNQ